MSSQTGVKSNRMQVIDDKGVFRSQDVEQFVSDHRLGEQHQNYQVVAIMGPQSSGKSTLLNHVFGTSFVMMDAMAGRSQTTKGIWMARSSKISEPATLVMDLEGADGRERGEDDTNFERQSALFALAVADVLLVNIWCHDIGREQGSGKPLLRTIFQVNLKLFAPEPDRKRTVLLFVLRDKTKTPLPRLVETLEQDLTKMWASISKPAQYTDSTLQDFFEVQYAGLSHFEEKYEDFLADTVVLRRRFTADADDTLLRSTDKLPGGALALSMGSIWEVIRSQKDLNLPAHKVMVANIRCAEIKDDQIRNLVTDQAWQTVVEQAQSGSVVSSFGATLHSLADSCIKGYEAEAIYFDPKVRGEKLEELQAKLQSLLQPLVAQQTAALSEAKLRELQQELKLGMSEGKEGFADLAAQLRQTAIDLFAHAFAQDVLVPGMPWDGKAELTGFTSTVDSHIAKVRSEGIAAAMSKAERQLAAQLSGPVISLLDVCPQGLWSRLHALCQDASSSAEKSVCKLLEGYKLSSQEQQAVSSQLAGFAWSRVEGHVREAALTRMSRMKDKFTEVFTLDKNKTPRLWSPREEIPTLAREARLAAATVLSQLVVLRPWGPAASASGAEQGAQQKQAYAAVEQAVMQLVQNDLQGQQQEASSSGSSSALHDSLVDILSAAAWPGVEEEQVLLQPHEVRTTWREFMSSSNVLVQQALSAQQANKMASSRAPPLWAIMAILVLGWNEFMGLLFNPLLLILGLVLFLFGRTLYFELDVDAEMQKGSLPGAISLMHKFVPASKAVVSRTAQSLKSFASHLPEHASRAQEYLTKDERQSRDEVQMSHLPQRHGTSSSAADGDSEATGLKQRRTGAQGSGEDGGHS